MKKILIPFLDVYKRQPKECESLLTDAQYKELIG